jgi:hypothetical protein
LKKLTVWVKWKLPLHQKIMCKDQKCHSKFTRSASSTWLKNTPCLFHLSRLCVGKTHTW